MQNNKVYKKEGHADVPEIHVIVGGRPHNNAVLAAAAVELGRLDLPVAVMGGFTGLELAHLFPCLQVPQADRAVVRGAQDQAFETAAYRSGLSVSSSVASNVIWRTPTGWRRGLGP